MNSSPLLQAMRKDAARGESVAHETIAEHARAIWADRGRPEGCDLEIWLEAEAEILSTKLQIQPQTGKDHRHA